MRRPFQAHGVEAGAGGAPVQARHWRVAHFVVVVLPAHEWREKERREGELEVEETVQTKTTSEDR